MTTITILNLFHDARNADNRVGYVPIGPLYITAALEEAGYQVDFRDYLVGSAAYDAPLDPDSVYDYLDRSADIIGIGCAGELLPLAILTARQIKRAHPDKIIILGGIGATSAAEDILLNVPFVDIVVKGEGERTAVELIKKLEKGSSLENVQGICYRTGNQVRTTPTRKRIDSLDQLPFPAYHKIDIDEYADVAIYSARGCPYRCTFCDVAPFWGRQNYGRSPGNTLDEIVMLNQKYHCQKIDIMDDILMLERKRILDFCRAVEERGVDFQWGCCGRIDLMDGELMSSMAKSGCRMIFYGVESGSDNVLEKIDKGFTVRQARDVLRESTKYFHVVVSLMWGFPFETMEDFHQTLELKNFIHGIGGDVDIYLLSALPLSGLYRDYKNRLQFSQEKYDQVFRPGHKETAAFIQRYPALSQWFYRYPTAGFQEKFRLVGHIGR